MNNRAIRPDLDVSVSGRDPAPPLAELNMDDVDESFGASDTSSGAIDGRPA